MSWVARGFTSVRFTPCEDVVEAGSDAIVDDAQFAFMGIAPDRMEAAREVAAGHLRQFATAEAVDLLRAVRRSAGAADEKISSADPLNLAGILLPGGRIHPLSGAELYLLGSNGTE